MEANFDLAPLILEEIWDLSYASECFLNERVRPTLSAIHARRGLYHFPKCFLSATRSVSRQGM